MSAYETFYLLFKAETEQLKKEVATVKKQMEDLNKTSKDTESQTKKTDNEFVNLAKTLAGLATAYFSVGAVVGAFRSSIAGATELSQFARETSISVEELDAWSRATERAGGTAADFQNSLLTLTKNWNTTPPRALDRIFQLADEVKRLEAEQPGQGKYYAERWGVTPGFVPRLLGGGDALRQALALQKELGVLTTEEAKAADQYRIASLDLGYAIDDFLRVTDAIPKLTALIESLTDLFRLFSTNVEENKSGNRDAGTSETSFFQLIGDFLFKHGKPSISYGAESKGSESSSGSLGNSEEANKLQNNSGIDEVYEIPSGFNQTYQIPTTIAPMSNSQSRNLYMGDININATEKEARAIGNEVISQLDQRESSMLAQLQHANSQFDDGVVV
jgi:hypothetical protein